jgi:hypothetical protein
MKVTVSDMAFAAYLVSMGKVISTVLRTGKKVSWVFDMSEEEYRAIESAWPSSPECAFFNVYTVLKGHLKAR